MKFKQTPMCEVCGKNEATAFTAKNPQDPKWRFSCSCTDGTDFYDIPFRRFFASPSATVDWLAHMNEKRWMDWTDFMGMMGRFRHATDSYFALGG